MRRLLPTDSQRLSVARAVPTRQQELPRTNSGSRRPRAMLADAVAGSRSDALEPANQPKTARRLGIRRQATAKTAPLPAHRRTDRLRYKSVVDSAMPEASHTVPLLARVQPSLSDELSRYLTQHRSAVEAQIRAGGAEAGVVAGSGYARAIDGLLCSLFSALRATMSGMAVSLQ